MAGIIEGQMQQQDQAPGADALDPVSPQNDIPQASGGGASAVERVVVAAQRALYDQQTAEKIVEMVRGAPSPAEGLAGAAAMLISEMWQASKQSIPKEAIWPALEQILELIAELAQAAGIEITPQVVAQAKQLFVRQAQAAAQKGQQQPGQQAQRPPQQVQQPAQQPQPGL